MTDFAIPRDESSPAEAELSAHLTRFSEPPGQRTLLFLVVNRNVMMLLVASFPIRGARGRWA